MNSEEAYNTHKGDRVMSKEQELLSSGWTRTPCWACKAITNSDIPNSDCTICSGDGHQWSSPPMKSHREHILNLFTKSQ